MELKFLKSQLNPHFLFNTLNNLDSLITLGRNKEASQTTIRLSQFMRYTLYDCNDDFIALHKEVELIKNYIELERIRHQNLHVEMDFRIGTNDRLIPPLLLLPFVENAFKHGVDLGISEAKISILLQEDEHEMVYIVENTTSKHGRAEKGGIGLNNVKGRLQYYYRGRHELCIKEDNNCYRIKLKISA